MDDKPGTSADEGSPAGVPHELRVELREQYVTTATWTETGEVSPTASCGRWVVDQTGRMGLRKPGSPRPCSESLGPYREFIVSELGRWLQVRVPVVELQETFAGPTIISLAVGKSILKWGQVMIDPTAQSVRSSAIGALGEYSGVIILDALVGNQDRTNPGNHVYVEERQEWFAVDFTISFGRNDDPRCGDPNQPFTERYYPEIIEAVRSAPDVLARTAKLAERLVDQEIEQLFAAAPASFATEAQRGAMIAYVKGRRSNIRNLVRNWAKSVGLGDEVKL